MFLWLSRWNISSIAEHTLVNTIKILILIALFATLGRLSGHKIYPYRIPISKYTIVPKLCKVACFRPWRRFGLFATVKCGLKRVEKNIRATVHCLPFSETLLYHGVPWLNGLVRRICILMAES